VAAGHSSTKRRGKTAAADKDFDGAGSSSIPDRIVPEPAISHPRRAATVADMAQV